MPRNSRLKLHEFVADLVDAGVEVLTGELKASPSDAHAAMLLITRAVCFRNAKSTVYVPAAENLAKSIRNAEIWAAYQTDGGPPSFAKKFSGARVQQLAVQFDLSLQMVYLILRDGRALAAPSARSEGVAPEPVIRLVHPRSHPDARTVQIEDTATEGDGAAASPPSSVGVR